MIFDCLGAMSEPPSEKRGFSSLIKRSSEDDLTALLKQKGDAENQSPRDATSQDFMLLEDKKISAILPVESIKEILITKHYLGLRDEDIRHILDYGCLVRYEDLPPVHMRLGERFLVTTKGRKKYLFNYFSDAADYRGTVTTPDGIRFWFSDCAPGNANP